MRKGEGGLRGREGVRGSLQNQKTSSPNTLLRQSLLYVDIGTFIYIFYRKKLPKFKSENKGSIIIEPWKKQAR